MHTNIINVVFVFTNYPEIIYLSCKYQDLSLLCLKITNTLDFTAENRSQAWCVITYTPTFTLSLSITKFQSADKQLKNYIKPIFQVSPKMYKLPSVSSNVRMRGKQKLKQLGGFYVLHISYSRDSKRTRYIYICLPYLYSVISSDSHIFAQVLCFDYKKLSEWQDYLTRCRFIIKTPYCEAGGGIYRLQLSIK